MRRWRSRSGCSARWRTAACDHLLIAAPFFVASWLLLALNVRAFRALTLGEDAAASLGVDIDRTRLMVVIGVALGVGAAVAVAGSIGFIGLVAPHLVRRSVGSDPARVCLPAALMGAALLHRRRHRGAAGAGQSQRHRGRDQARRGHRADRRAVLPGDDLPRAAAARWSAVVSAATAAAARRRRGRSGSATR